MNLNQAHVRAYIRDYITAKHSYFSILVVSADSHPAGFYGEM